MNERHHEQSPSYVASTAHALGITCWAISKVFFSLFFMFMWDLIFELLLRF